MAQKSAQCANRGTSPGAHRREAGGVRLSAARCGHLGGPRASPAGDSSREERLCGCGEDQGAHLARPAWRPSGVAHAHSHAVDTRQPHLHRGQCRPGRHRGLPGGTAETVTTIDALESQWLARRLQYFYRHLLARLVRLERPSVPT